MTLTLKIIYVESFALNPWASWPCQPFPANEFRTIGQQELIKARYAWSLFESVEAVDSRTRIMLSGTPNTGSSESSLWYELGTEAASYRYGQTLHTRVCPEISWNSQRQLGIPKTRITTLTLALTIPFPINPSSVQAIPDVSSAIVQWPKPNSVTPIVSYTVRSTPGNFMVTTLNASRLSVIVAGLSNGTSYTFTVTSKDIYGLVSTPSAPSNAVVPRTLPSPPRNVTATFGLESVTVTWLPPLDNGGGAIVSYTVVCNPGDIYVTTTDLSATITGLTEGVDYTFVVTATNIWGLGSIPSNNTNPVSPIRIPDSPTNVFGDPGPSSVVLTWTAPSSYSGIMYAVQTTTTTGVDISAGLGGVYNISSTTTTVTGLVNGTSYVFRIRAYISFGSSDVSLPSNIITPADIPNAPVVSVSYGNYGLPVLSWPFPTNNGSFITEYTVYVRDSSNNLVSTETPTPSTRRYITLSDLTYGSTYTCRVTASNEVGESAYSNTVTVSPLSAPLAPVDISAVAFPGGAFVSWSRPLSNGSNITGYTITNYTGIRAVGTTQVAATDTSANILSLVNGTTYTFVVVARNSAGTSEPSLSSNPVTPLTVPGLPRKIIGTGSNNTVTVSWTAPTSNGGTPILSYRVTALDVSSGQILTPLDISASVGQIVTFTGLTNGRSYRFAVFATNKYGTSPDSTSVRVVVVPADFPPAPLDVSGFSSDSTATISWSDPTNNSGNEITSYIAKNTATGVKLTFYRDSGSGINTYSAPFTGIVNGTRYKFTVQSVSPVGGSSLAEVFVTPSTAPVIQSVSTDLSSTPGVITVGWTILSDGLGSSSNNFRLISSTVTAYLSATNAQVGSPVTIADSSGRTYSFSGLTGGVTYKFSISSRNVNNLTSNLAYSADRQALSPPGAPSDVSATPFNRLAYLKWTEPASNGATITKYSISAIPSSGSTVTQTYSSPFTIDGNGKTTYTFFGLNNISYTFTVTAYNSIGYGTPSSPTSATTLLSQVITVAGALDPVANTGIRGYVNGDGQVAQFMNPMGITMDTAGNIFVSEAYGNRIRKMTPTTVNGITTWNVINIAGGSRPGLVDGIGENALFYFPSNLTIDPANNIYIADTFNKAVRLISPVNNFGLISYTVSTIIKNMGGLCKDVKCYSDSYGYSYLWVVTYGGVYCLDLRPDVSPNFRLIAGGTGTAIVNKDGTFSSNSLTSNDNISGHLDGPGESAKFKFPVAMAYYSTIVNGYPVITIYVADYGNHCIRCISPSNVVTTIAGGIDTSVTPNIGIGGVADGSGSVARFQYPTAIVLDASSNLYVTDYTSRIRYVRLPYPGATTQYCGIVTSYAGAYTRSYSDGSLTVSRFNTPSNLIMDRTKTDIFIADSDNNMIRQILR